MNIRVLVLSICMLVTVSPVFGEDKADFKTQKE